MVIISIEQGVKYILFRFCVYGFQMFLLGFSEFSPHIHTNYIPYIYVYEHEYVDRFYVKFPSPARVCA